MLRIDAHVNLGNGIYKQQDVETILHDMEANGIDRSVLCPVEEYVTVRNREGNKMILEACREYPDKFYGFAVANPWYREEAVVILTEAFEAGLHGAFFVSSLQGFSIDDYIVDPLIEVCRKYQKPVYFHTGTPAFALPPQLTCLAKRFPDVNFIMGHSGANDFCGDVDISMQTLPNIYLETSLNFYASIMGMVDKYPDRVIFGSDTPRSPLDFELKKTYRASTDPNVMDGVLGGNLLRILKGGNLA